jgi:hypothetical protein
MISDIPILRQYKSTIREVSEDTENNSSLVISDTEVYSFDKLAQEFSQNAGFERPCSSDALYIKNNEFYFIEFKNGSLEKARDKPEIAKIKLKICESLLLFEKIAGIVHLSADKIFHYILVYNETKNPKTYIEAFTQNRAKKAFDPFGLKRFEIYFQNVCTYNTEEFQVNFIDKCAALK